MPKKERNFKTIICGILNRRYGKKAIIAEEDVVDNDKNRWTFMQALQTLDPREAATLVAYDFCNKSFRQVGAMFGLSGNRVMQIRSKAYRKLRHPVRSRRIINFLKEDVANAVKEVL